MIEPPSPQLINTLNEFGLCRPSDLRRCRPWIRKLAQDLPAFDSVWIDALVHTRKLTHFQARELESGRHQRLSVGPCTLIDRLGRSDQSETFLARQRTTGEKCVLKLMQVSIEDRAARLAELKELSAAVRPLLPLRQNAKGQTGPHPSYVAPQNCLEHDGQLVAISRFVPGLHLGELLVRRGRFGPANVTAIARQLVDALATLEAHGRVHGDVCLSNIRLTSSGVAVLVDTGILAIVRPELSIHARRPPHRYDGIAPELIGTGQHASPQSDLYALGCLLWQLLAGRPPFPTGDPLGKLACHQTKDIRDVRDWVPDTPASLAELIASLTAREPLDRPASIMEVRDRLGAPGRGARRRLRRFRAAFETAAPRNPFGESSGGTHRWLLLPLLLLAGLSLTLLDPDVRRDPLCLPGKVAAVLQEASSRAKEQDEQRSSTAEDRKLAQGANRSSSLHTLPAPNAEGVIVLDSDRPYVWRELKSNGDVIIRGNAGVNSTIVVDDQSCLATADRLAVENVRFVYRPRGKDAADDIPAMLRVVCRQLLVARCSFDTEQSAGSGPDAVLKRTGAAGFSPAAIAWQGPGGGEPAGARISIRDTMFFGEASSLLLADVPERVLCDNCGRIGGGPMFRLAANLKSRKPLSLQLKQLTLRGAASLLEWQPPADTSAQGFVAIHADDCVFDLAEENAALLRIISDKLVDAATARVAVIGDESLARPDLVIAQRQQADCSARAGCYSPLRDGRVVQLEGISTGAFTFAGPPSRTPRDAVVETFSMPRRTPEPPGIDAGRLDDTIGRGVAGMGN